ncbi:helix-turn-helix transcriptional regulator [Dyadobacter sediminis]|uniref:Helix-turn-helix transcriptional regulator n=1 Tax=Dyadobacter sediminis TaxID=1493691 RepID=A0A5R9KIS7_9BACT|nr:AraC family transcriptional regulator [Dyadobacter sediminis]TLU96084.1 helix-turn-helix transcriptional regulator [Dyadobacter sediminis]GGB79108.1 AraC family transcriptional regulator [Dyadobacter sediminis]
MIFSFSATPDFDFMTYFARHIHATIHNGVLEIPESLGQGFIRKLEFGQDFKITIHHYLLIEDLVIKRNASGMGNELITVFFYSNEQSLGIAFNDDRNVTFSQRDDSAVQVTSNDISSTVRFPADQQIHYVVVAIKPGRLKELIHINEPNSVIQTITGTGNSFLFFESMNAETKTLLKNMLAVDMNDTLSNFYMQIKVQELLYLNFHKLSLRESAAHHTINSTDAAKLLQIRNEILKDLSIPPVLKELAGNSAMSESKLKQLFKQTFGSSIYSFYQQARMEEAAFLLKHGKGSVAEVGYEMGFSNLSHFSRLFEKHYGQNPKRYSYS